MMAVVLIAAAPGLGSPATASMPGPGRFSDRSAADTAVKKRITVKPVAVSPISTAATRRRGAILFAATSRFAARRDRQDRR
jgi:hypothetical protein